LTEFAREMDQRTLYLFDVRSPEEFLEGHLHSTVSAPGGQLVQTTDSFAATRNARICLIDDHGVRATMTASWLIQMGWKDVFVVKDALSSGPLMRGAAPIDVLGLAKMRCGDMVTPAALAQQLQSGNVTVIDLDSKPRYGEGHIPGAWHAIRANLGSSLGRVPLAKLFVVTSADGIVAQLAAPEITQITGVAAKVLAGGTAAWKRDNLPLEQGETRLTDTMDDVWVKAHDRKDNREQAMKDYLSWEVDLITQIRRDDDVEFRHFPA
jgi:rhodanese-related sulfurtransferase